MNVFLTELLTQRFFAKGLRNLKSILYSKNNEVCVAVVNVNLSREDLNPKVGYISTMITKQV